MIYDEMFFVKRSSNEILEWLKSEFKKQYLPFIYKPNFREEDEFGQIIEINVDLWTNEAGEPFEISEVFYFQVKDFNSVPLSEFINYGINIENLKDLKEWIDSDEKSLVIYGTSGSNLIPFPFINHFLEEFDFYFPYNNKEDYYQRIISKAENLGVSIEINKRTSSLINKGKRPKVFVSSTFEDLKVERLKLNQALQSMKSIDFSSMEFFGSKPEKPEDVSIKELLESDIYVGVFGFKYGSGITEREYFIAQENKKPCFIYFRNHDIPILPKYIENDPNKIYKLDNLKQRILDSHTISYFDTPDQLAMRVVIDLHNYLLANSKS